MTFSETDYCKDPLSVDTKETKAPTLNYLNYTCQQKMRLKNKGLKLSRKRGTDSNLLKVQGDETKTGFENEVTECYENINAGFLDLKHLNPEFWNAFTDVPSYVYERMKGDWDLIKSAGKFMGKMIPMMITAIFTEEGALMRIEGLGTEKAARMIINHTFEMIAKASTAVAEKLEIESFQKGAEAASRYFFTFTESIITRNFTNAMKIVRYGVQEAVEEGVGNFSFDEVDNYDKEFGMEYDGKVHLESIDLTCSYELVEKIVEQVHKLFTEAECPEDDDSQLNTQTVAEKII